MNGKAVAIFSAAMGFLSDSSFAENWVSYGESVNGSEHSIDRDTIVEESEYFEYWVKVDASRDASVEYRQTMTLNRAKCKQRQTASVYQVMYMPDGKNRSVGPFNFPTFTPVVPGSMGQAELEAVCAMTD